MNGRKMRGKMVAVFCVLMLMALLVSCGKSVKSQLVGSWYPNGRETGQRDGGRGPGFTLYSDGTCEIASEYGIGSWEVVNDNVLKLTNFYGETETAKILSVEDGCLTLENGAVFWSSPINENKG